MWYRKAQVAPAENTQAPAQAPAQDPAPQSAADQAIVISYQSGMNNILNQTGKTFLDIITELNNYKNTIASNASIEQNTKNNIVAIIDASITAVNASSGGNFNQPYAPPQASNTAVTEQIDQSNPASRLISPTSNTGLPGTGGLLTKDMIIPKPLTEANPAPADPNAQPQQNANQPNQDLAKVKK